MTGKSTVFPVSGSEVWGVWHITHNSTFRREPPCADRGSWHLLQEAVRTTSRVTFTADPSGTKLKTSFAYCEPRSNTVRLRVLYIPMECVAVRSMVTGAFVPNVY